MKRRDFLKMVVGAVAIPFVPTLIAEETINTLTDRKGAKEVLSIDFGYGDPQLFVSEEPLNKQPTWPPQTLNCRHETKPIIDFESEMTVIGWPSIINTGDIFTMQDKTFICTTTTQSSLRIGETIVNFKPYTPNSVKLVKSP